MTEKKMIDNIIYIAEAHQNYSKKLSKAFRKWDNETPYCIHPIWCATTMAAETMLDKQVKQDGILALLYHDILEDTTKILPHELPQRVQQLIHDMTFENGSKQEMDEIWDKPKEIRLYKLYDKTSNLMDGSWMNKEKRRQHENYTKMLCEDIEKNYR